MQQQTTQSWWWTLLGAILFAVAHTQSPLFYSNQNQYFLHGFARAGIGDLSADWMASTSDPTPVFSATLAFVVKLLGTWPIHGVFFLLCMIYFVSLMMIVAKTSLVPPSRAGHLLLMGLFIAMHAAIVRVASVHFLRMDYPWYFQAGVANQYLVGPGLQPSAFGVLLLAAIAFYMHGHHLATALIVAFTCTIHTTYLLPSALLIIGLSGQLAWKEARWRPALTLAGVCLLGVLPVIAAVYVVFRPSDAEAFREGQRLIAWVRIPHHTDVHRWLDPIAWCQIGWMLLGIACYRQSSLGWPLMVSAFLALILSVIQIASGSATLALLFPWRLSTVLMPLSTAILLALIVQFVRIRLVANVIAMVLMVGSIVGSVLVNAYGWGYQVSHAEDDVQQWVRSHRKPGEVYLIPTSFPKPPSSRGSSSSTFVPVTFTPGKTVFELQRFRMMTQAPAYVDFKSIPYADRDIIEWHRRVQNCVRWYQTRDWDATGIIDELIAEGITHVICPTATAPKATALQLLYATEHYSIFAVVGLQ